MRRFLRFRKTKTIAKDRLKILLISDRMSCSPKTMDDIRDDIAKLLSKYMKIDVNTMEIQISKTGMKSINNTKTPTLYANIPILDLRNK